MHHSQISFEVLEIEYKIGLWNYLHIYRRSKYFVFSSSFFKIDHTTTIHTIRVFELCLNEDRNYNAKINAKRCTFTIVISLSTSIVDLIINNHSRSGTIYFDIKQILDWKIIFIIPWVVSSFVTIGKNIKFFMTRIVLIDFVEISHLFCTFHLKNNKKKEQKSNNNSRKIQRSRFKQFKINCPFKLVYKIMTSTKFWTNVHPFVEYFH